MITITRKGDFDKIYDALDKCVSVSNNYSIFDEYGRRGVEALSSATPFLTGKTAGSWSYTVEERKNRIAIRFHNSNIQNGVPIAIILQYGHATRNGGYVGGIDYINPAIRPVFEELANELFREVAE